MSQWNIKMEGNSSEVWVYHVDRTPGMIEAHNFVARFKYSAPKRSANHFVKFLTTNFTPEEYFAAREEKDSRGLQKGPVTVLQAKGYVSYNEEVVNRLRKEVAQRIHQRETYIDNLSQSAGNIINLIDKTLEQVKK